MNGTGVTVPTRQRVSELDGQRMESERTRHERGMSERDCTSLVSYAFHNNTKPDGYGITVPERQAVATTVEWLTELLRVDWTGPKRSCFSWGALRE